MVDDSHARRRLARLSEVTDDDALRVVLTNEVHEARALVRDRRRDGASASEPGTRGAARERLWLWYLGGLLELFEQRRPGRATADLGAAVGELVWEVAREQAKSWATRRVWLDPDLYTCPAPDGWIQVRTAAEAILLLESFTVHELSLANGPEAERVIDWLIAHESDARDPWPTDRLRFHGPYGIVAIDQRSRTDHDPVAGSR